MQRFAYSHFFGNSAEKPVRESVRTRQVPKLDEASVQLHRGITANQEHFSLKAASERLKKHSGR